MQNFDYRYSFERGFPSGDTAQTAYDDADLNRAIEAYRFFYPTVSGHAIFKGNEKIGIVPNKVFGRPDMKVKWIKTMPGKGWFVYFRVYGPEKAAFDGSWKPGDFEEAK